MLELLINETAVIIKKRFWPFEKIAKLEISAIRSIELCEPKGFSYFYRISICTDSDTQIIDFMPYKKEQCIKIFKDLLTVWNKNS